MLCFCFSVFLHSFLWLFFYFCQGINYSSNSSIQFCLFESSLASVGACKQVLISFRPQNLADIDVRLCSSAYPDMVEFVSGPGNKIIKIQFFFIFWQPPHCHIVIGIPNVCCHGSRLNDQNGTTYINLWHRQNQYDDYPYRILYNICLGTHHPVSTVVHWAMANPQQ